MARKDTVKWIDPQPGDDPGGPPVKILAVRPGDKIQGFFISEHVHAVLTHWINRRTKPCVGIENGCEGCSIGAMARRKGYIACFLPGGRAVWLLEITDKAFDTCLALCRPVGLRGCKFTAKRAGKATNSALVVEVDEDTSQADKLPPDVNVPEILMRIWFGSGRKHPEKKGGGA